MKPRLHIVALPHAQTVRELTTCAFTAKIIKATKMLGSRGWPITLYSGDQNDAEQCEHVTLYASDEQHAWYGEIDPNTLPTKGGIWDADSQPWQITNERAIRAIRERAQPHDLILLTGGRAQKPIADALPQMLAVEWAAGYEGIFAPFVCFESQAWRHYLYGKYGMDGRFYDTVIPNFFDPDEWTLEKGRGDYLLYVGRIVQRKGVQVAVEVARATGRTLLLAGSGVVKVEKNRIVCEELVLEGADLVYVGTVDAKERSALMGRAAAVLVPTLYIEPFGAVAVEAQLCGTQPIATDFGAFIDTVAPQFRFRTLAEAATMVEKASQIDRETLRASALARYSLEAVAPLYEDWFTRLETLWHDGWYTDTDTAMQSSEEAA